MHTTLTRPRTIDDLNAAVAALTTAPGHQAQTFCNVACQLCDHLMTERSLDVIARRNARFERLVAQAPARTRPERRITARRDQHNDQGSVAFGQLWDAGRIEWVNDCPVVR